jgi:hypothetical protein
MVPSEGTFQLTYGSIIMVKQVKVDKAKREQPRKSLGHLMN